MPLRATTKKTLVAAAVGSLPFLAPQAAHADSSVQRQVSFTFEDPPDVGTTRTTCVFDYSASRTVPTGTDPYTTVFARLAINAGASDATCDDRITELAVTVFYRPEPGAGAYLSSTGRAEGGTAASVRVRDEGPTELSREFNIAAKVNDPCRPCALDTAVPAPK
jgi:hypothetical protein